MASDPVHLLVIGCGPAGHAAAEAYRDAGGTGRVVVLAGEGRPAYERPALSKELLRGETGPGDILLADADWLDAHRIELVHGSADALDPVRRVVMLSGGATVAYRACVLATGAEPVRPPVPGVRLPGVHVLRDVDQALALRASARRARRAVVVGSGFIGCEAAASLRMLGLDVTMLSTEQAPQQARLGREVAGRLAAWLCDDGVRLLGASELQAVAVQGRTLVVQHSGGDLLAADLVLLATGVRPCTALARDAGLALADGGEVLADAGLASSATGVLACGDCCRAEHAIAGRALHVEHWGDALAQGEAAGRRAAGVPATWSTVPGFWSTIGDRTLKYAAWGDGHDEADVVEHGDGAFTVSYRRDGACVGVLTHDRDEDYEAGRERIEREAGCRA